MGKLKVMPSGMIGGGELADNFSFAQSLKTSAIQLAIHVKRSSALSSFKCSSMDHDF